MTSLLYHNIFVDSCCLLLHASGTPEKNLVTLSILPLTAREIYKTTQHTFTTPFIFGYRLDNHH